MKQEIFILGAGGFAKEVYTLIKQIGQYNVKAFVDYSAKESIHFSTHSIPVISEEIFFAEYNYDTNICIGVGDPVLINKLATKFAGYSFPNLIHPSATVDADEISLGYGNIITAGVCMTVNIRIGNLNIFNLCATVGHDSIIGNYNVINPSVNVSGGVTVGDMNLLGVSSTILQYKKIGNKAIVGASSLVTKDVEDNTTVIGVPAKSK